MRRNTSESAVQEGSDENDQFSETWPHAFNPALACLGCTLGLLNIDRFATSSVQFGANFIVQFLIMSLLVGIPLLTLQVCLGQKLKTGILNMWRISPLFQGVGIALLAVQIFIGIYSIIGVSWMLVYLRDSFAANQERYRWAEDISSDDNSKLLRNVTVNKVIETTHSYFNHIVLQRQNITKPYFTTTLKFQVAFNLAVVWMIIFLSLSKGLKSYGKVIYLYTLIPILSTLVLCVKLLCLTPENSVQKEYPSSAWKEFFSNGKSWIAASSEAFSTWGLLGTAAMQIAAQNKDKHLLKRNTAFVVILTLVILLLNAFIANTCVRIIEDHGHNFTASFGKMSNHMFLHRPDYQINPVFRNTNEKFTSRASFLLGQRIVQNSTDLINSSGYQVLRFSTELVPSTIALLGIKQMPAFWTVLFYLALIFFGITQQLAIWHCVITGFLSISVKRKRIWDTKITFFSCICAYILGLPMATELGFCIIYFLDFVIGGSWWIMILYLIQFGAVFAVRGRPYTGESIVAELFSSTDRFFKYWLGPALSFIWNIILPITLVVLSVMVFKSGGFKELYSNHEISKYYWTIWVREIGITIQLLPILIIPGVAIVQTWRYLHKGPPDIFDRMQLLCRPPLEFAHQDLHEFRNGESSINRESEDFRSTTELTAEDLPPKYTPPPSYTTATGARIAKILRQSFRSSIRRIGYILDESNILKTKHTLQQSPPEYKP